MDEKDDEFAVPEHFIGKQVVIKMDIPIVPPNGQGFALPSFTAMLKADLRGALLLQVGSTESVYLKRRVWQIDKESDIAIATTMPSRLGS